MKKKRITIGMKMRIFVTLIVFVISVSIALLSYFINVGQNDSYIKRMTYNSAENYATLVDPEFLSELRKTAESEEFQALRNDASMKDDESAIEKYLKDKGLWDKYAETRKEMCNYLDNMDDIKYLYIIVLGDSSAYYDMYLVDDYDNPLYETGNYQDRESGLIGVDTSKKIEPAINNSKWGWLCSAYAPVCDSQGNIVCHIGCDFDMETIVGERTTQLLIFGLVSLGLTVFAYILTLIIFNLFFTKPFKRITEESKKFDPEKFEPSDDDNIDYNKPGVINLYLKKNDEITDIYEIIRSIQVSFIDFLDDKARLEKDKQRYLDILRQVETENKDKKEQLEKVSDKAYRDELTQVGNKNAYIRKINSLAKNIEKGSAKFAIAMIDLNNLKYINDYYGHESGDIYIKGSCQIVTRAFRNSPLYRVGGDEFVVILMGEDYRNRDAIVSQARDDFMKSYQNTSVPPYERFCAAVGLAVYSEGDTVETVFKRADQAMYAEKMLFKMKNGSYR